MNYFFGIKSEIISSKIEIPVFQNNGRKTETYSVYSAVVKKNKWNIERENLELKSDFYEISDDKISNDKIFFLADEKEVKNKIEDKLINYNNFTNTIPSFRANLEIQFKNKLKSSYQSEYPYGMVLGVGNILTSISTLTQNDAEQNFLIFKNIYYKPINVKKFIYVMDKTNLKIIKKFTVITNYTNLISLDSNLINKNYYILSDQILGIPIFLSVKGNSISLEHTHPLQHYILGEDQKKTTNEIKKFFYESII